MRRRVVVGSLALSVLAVVALGGWWGARATAPLRDRAQALATYRPATSIRVVDRNGLLLDEIGVDRRWVSIDELPPVVVDAFVAAEDRRFWTHSGFDPRGIARAAWVNWRAGGVEEGGSTITQQVVKLLVVGDESSLERKVKEVLAARALEQALPKERVLELYLNVVYLGGGAYGVDAAARAWFGVGADELEAHEAALLASLVPAPSVRSPRRDPEAARRRRDVVLHAMADAGSLTRDEADAASARPLGLVEETGPRPAYAAYRTETRRLLERLLGPEPPSELGLVVHTAVDLDVQRLAEVALRDAIDDVDQRRRRRAHQPPRAAGEAPGVEGAAVVLDTTSGEVLALVGGYDDRLGGLVRATRSRRQPGSAFKPVVFAAALEDGASPGDIVLDEPVVFPGAEGTLWTPGNHQDLYRGPITLREALAVSSNSVAVTLADDVGLDAVVAEAHELGIRTELRADLSLALGASEVTPLELAVVYETIARGGVPAEPVLVTRIADAEGTVLVRAGGRGAVGDREVELPGGEGERALEPAVAWALQRMLKACVDYGTGLDAHDPVQERAGKTGTTNDYGDAWFVGFTPRHTIAVWIGDDDHERLGPGETGGRVAIPAWVAIAEGLGTPGTAAEPERLPARPPRESEEVVAALGSIGGQ